MNIIIVVTFLILCAIIISINQCKLAKKISLVIYIEWLCLLIISLTNPKNLYPIDEITYLYLCLFPFMFLIGITSNDANKQYNQKTDFSNLTISFNRIATNKWLLFIVVVADLLLFFIYQQSVTIINSMSALEYRNNGGPQLIFDGNSLLGLLYSFIINPLIFFSNLFLSFLLLFNRKKNIPIILYAIFIILRSLIEGQRSGLLDLFFFIIFFVFCCSMFSIENKISSKKNKPIKTFIVIGFLALSCLIGISFMTNQRLTNNNEFNIENIISGIDETSTHIVTYSVGPFRALDYALKNDYVNNHFNGYKFGQSTLGFIDYGIQLICKNIGINYEAGNKEVYSYLQNNWIRIPSNFNFAYTAIFNFYVDFGFLGILFIPYILGLIFISLISKFNRYKNPILFIAIAYLFFITFNCYFTWRLYDLSALITICWIYLFYKIEKKHIKSNKL